jgi:hypothetical protein
MAPVLTTLAQFITDVEDGLISDIFSITVGTEKRVYGKTPKGQANNPKRFIVVYAVVT